MHNVEKKSFPLSLEMLLFKIGFKNFKDENWYQNFIYTYLLCVNTFDEKYLMYSLNFIFLTKDIEWNIFILSGIALFQNHFVVYALPLDILYFYKI